MEDYRTIRGTAIGEYEEKKSRFIAQLAFADSEEKAVAFLEQVRAANRTARHNVYAYRLREGNRERYSDDGEPAKTAGTPALEVLQHSGLTDLIVVVTRYCWVRAASSAPTPPRPPAHWKTPRSSRCAAWWSWK